MPFATVRGSVPQQNTPHGERLNYLRLWDSYGALLTETQREICKLYYLCDLSLSEIAELKSVSKQAVSDALKKSRELLDFYEEKLHHSAQNIAYSQAVSDMMTKVTRALAALGEEHPELKDQIAAIDNMVCVGEVVPSGGEE